MLVRRLEELDRSSIGFPEQLDELLHDRKWVESLKLLSEEESCELIDYLDNVGLILTPNKPHLSPLDSR